LFPTPESVKDTAEFWLPNLERFNGLKWWPNPISIKVTADASRVGFGGIPTAGDRKENFTRTFLKEQKGGSSTAREVRGYAAAIVIAAQQFPTEFHGTSILVEGDNQGHSCAE
jgi:hypothetical protein